MTRADQFFNASKPYTPPPRKTKERQPRFIVERRLANRETSPWQPTLDAYASTQSEAYRTLDRCTNSALTSYRYCQFRVRRLADDRIMREANHRIMAEKH